MAKSTDIRLSVAAGPSSSLPHPDEVRRAGGDRRGAAARRGRGRNPRRPPRPRLRLDADGQRLGVAESAERRPASARRDDRPGRATGGRGRPISAAAAIRWRSPTTVDRATTRRPTKSPRPLGVAEPMPRLAQLVAASPMEAALFTTPTARPSGRTPTTCSGRSTSTATCRRVSRRRVRRRVSRSLHAPAAEAVDAAVSPGRRAGPADRRRPAAADRRRPAGNAARVDRRPTA